MLEKLHGFAEGKYDITVSGNEIATDYETKRTDAWQEVEGLAITQRFVSTCELFSASSTLHVVRNEAIIDLAYPAKLVQSRRAVSGGATTSSLGRSPTTSTIGSATSSVTSPSYAKKPPPPPPGAGLSAPPPPYSAGPSSPTGFGAKKAPPPPPPVKPKPKPAVQYVVALYDFAPQAEGDLEFSAGDRIEVVERTGSAEDWWTGRIGDRQGVFPGACGYYAFLRAGV